MADKYLVKADYECPIVATGGVWITVESETKPQLGLSKKDLLSPHGCKRYYYVQSCEEDPNCKNQRILEIRNFSETEARKLNASQLEGCLKNA